MDSSMHDLSLEKECSSCIKGNEEPMICLSVKLLDKKKKDKAVLYASTTSIHFLEPRGKSYSVMETIPYENISKLTLANKSTMEIHYSKNSIEFEHLNMIGIYKSFYLYICSILLESNIPKFKYEQKDAGKIRYAKQFIYRFKYVAVKNKVKNPFVLAEKIEKLINPTKLKILDLTSNEDLTKNADTLIECIECLPFLYEVVIPQGKHSWANFVKCIKYDTRITSIITCDPFDSSFKHILDDIPAMKHSTLKQITFKNKDIAERDAQHLRSFISVKRLDTLAFDRCFNANTFSKILLQISKDSGFKSITNWEFYNIDGIKATELFVYAPNLETVKFSKCNISFPSIFTCIPLTLKKIIIENDVAQTNFGAINPPDCLTTVEFKNIKWEPNILYEALTKFVNMHPTDGLSLDFSGIQMTDSQWNLFAAYDIDVSADSTLKNFIWNNNPITPPIMSMLSKLNVLQLLSISGSLSDQTILPFTDFIESCESITNLVICAGAKPIGTEKCITLMRGLRNARNVESLILNDHLFGEEGALALTDLLMTNKSIRSCEFENNDLRTKDIWFYILEKLTVRGPPLELQWPREVDELLESNTIDHNEWDHLHDCWTNIQNGSEEQHQDEEGQQQLDFGNEIESDQEQEEVIAPLDWDLQIPDVPLPSTDSIVSETIKRFNYATLVDSIIKN